MQRLIIPGRLPGYNELVKGHWASRHAAKKAAMDIVGWEARRQHIQPVKEKATVAITCYEQNARRDDDNTTSGAAKVILDALQTCGILRGDGQKYVRCVKMPVEIDRTNPRIEVEIVCSMSKGKHANPERG